MWCITITLSSYAATMKVRDDVEIDYGLVSDANFSTKGRVVTDHKVRFIYQALQEFYSETSLYL